MTVQKRAPLYWGCMHKSAKSRRQKWLFYSPFFFLLKDNFCIQAIFSWWKLLNLIFFFKPLFDPSVPYSVPSFIVSVQYLAGCRDSDPSCCDCSQVCFQWATHIPKLNLYPFFLKVYFNARLCSFVFLHYFYLLLILDMLQYIFQFSDIYPFLNALFICMYNFSFFSFFCTLPNTYLARQTAHIAQSLVRSSNLGLLRQHSRVRIWPFAAGDPALRQSSLCSTLWNPLTQAKHFVHSYCRTLSVSVSYLNMYA